MSYPDAVKWWLHYLRILTAKPPWAVPGKITIGVSSHTGEEIANVLELTPKEADGSLQIDVDDTISIEWTKAGENRMGWGGERANDPDPRDRYFRNAKGALELKKKWPT